MRLVIVRHGIAIDREDPTCPSDAERPLTDKGTRRTKAAARGLATLGIEPLHIFSSPYVRAAQTADILARVLTKNRVSVLDVDELLPGRHPREFLRVIRDVDDGDVICTGHAPLLDLILAASVGMPATFTHLKKAGAALVEFWPDHPSGELAWVLPPRVLRRLGRDA